MFHTPLLQYAHSNSQLLSLCLNCSLVSVLHRSCGSLFQIGGVSGSELWQDCTRNSKTSLSVSSCSAARYSTYGVKACRREISILPTQYASLPFTEWLSGALMRSDKHSLWWQAEWGSHGVYWAEDCWTYVWRAATSFLGSGWMDRTAEPGLLCHRALVDSRLLFGHGIRCCNCVFVHIWSENILIVSTEFCHC